MKLSKAYVFLVLIILFCSVLGAETQKADNATGIDKLKLHNITFSDANFYKYLNQDKAEIIRAFLDAGYDLNKRNQASQTPLIVASMKGALDVCELLVSRGADVNATDIDKSTALMYAASCKRASIVNLLVINKADVNLQNDKGWTALMFAIEGGSRETIDAVITVDTDPMLRNNDNKTARDYARKHKYGKLNQYIRDKIAYLEKIKKDEARKTIIRSQRD